MCKGLTIGFARLSVSPVTFWNQHIHWVKHLLYAAITCQSKKKKKKIMCTWFRPKQFNPAFPALCHFRYSLVFAQYTVIQVACLRTGVHLIDEGITVTLLKCLLAVTWGRNSFDTDSQNKVWQAGHKAIFNCETENSLALYPGLDTRLM